MSSIDQQFVEFIVKSLVGNPDAVSIERRIDEKGVLLELTVDPEDLGRVIGKRGATAQSLRTLLRALGTKNEARYNLKIVDNGEPRPQNASAGNSDDSADSSSSADGTSAVSSGADAPAVAQDDDMSGSAYGPTGTTDEDDDFKRDNREDTSSVVSKTRKELEEFDDLDV